MSINSMVRRFGWSQRLEISNHLICHLFVIFWSFWYFFGKGLVVIFFVMFLSFVCHSHVFLSFGFVIFSHLFVIFLSCFLLPYHSWKPYSPSLPFLSPSFSLSFSFVLFPFLVPFLFPLLFCSFPFLPFT